MPRLAQRVRSIEKRQTARRTEDPRRQSPQAWTRRFLAADPAHAALVARISARPTSIHMCRHPDGNTHLGFFMIGLAHEVTYDHDANGNLIAVAMDGLPNQLEALELLGELSRVSQGYQARTGDLFPMLF